jgi:hypothetical protein
MTQINPRCLACSAGDELLVPGDSSDRVPARDLRLRAEDPRPLALVRYDSVLGDSEFFVAESGCISMNRSIHWFNSPAICSAQRR